MVMSGWKRKDGPVVGEYFGKGDLPKDWFTKLLEGTRILVGQNIKFDLLYALREEHNLVAWMEWVANGGNVWDIQLAEYLLSGMDPADHMLSLDELAPRYGGNVKFDEVKALWALGVETTDIDQELLTKYLCGTRKQVPGIEGLVWVGDMGDVENTELVFQKQLAVARARGQVKSIMLNMGSLLATIEMERNGMRIDKELGEKQAKELEAKIAVLDKELSEYIPADLPFEFNWGSPQQKSALIFGGKVKYEARTPILKEDGTQAYAQKTIKVPVLDDMGCQVFVKSGKNAGEKKFRNETVDDLDKPKSRMEDYWCEFPGYTEPEERWKGASGYSTAAEVIEELSFRDIPFLKALGSLTAARKDLGTYYIAWDEKKKEFKGMLTLVQPDGIVHHNLNHTSTVTARFSSSSPNLQNLPKKDKSTVKSLFISRFESGRIIQSDFTSLEVYIQAMLTGDQQLIADLLAGLDMHCSRVASKEGISYEDALLWCKGDARNGIEPKDGWPKKRSDAKEFSFQRAYGAGASKIALTTGMAFEDVEALIKAEQARYPQIERYYEKLTEEIKQNSVSTGKVSEHPDVPGLKCFYRKSMIRTPDNKAYSYRDQASPSYLAKRPVSQGGCATSFSPTEIKNYVVQGEGGEWAKAAMWIAVRAFYARKNFDGLALLVNQVHDAVYADAAESVSREAAALLEACMVAASEFMEWYFGWPVPCPVPSETVSGASMIEEKPFDQEFPLRVRELRLELRKVYMEDYKPSFEKG
ncbi:DNA polymerase [Caulobacter phage Lullwater]|uniref:DNA polymerase I n=1 Tax=Caulobacter phage Lullwater TaxID=2024607 RepID=A0A291LB98_9CAUD|nr:DNA polymerase [Caulobacter phage Lullwater]ATI16325.1 DNA polymerase I [Caulobacter phage Lullwater]